MIKINLLAQRRSSRADRGIQEILLGLVVIAVAGVLVWLFVHRPLQSDISEIKETNEKIANQNRAKQQKLAEETTIKAAVESLQKKKDAVAELDNLRSTPAYMLRELGRIMTPNRMPTMTREMAAEVEGASLHRKLSLEWDPKHAWISKFEEKKGQFTIEGGAQSDGDVIQLAKRLEASVHFMNVVSKGGKEVSDSNSGVTYFTFTITGEVVY